MAPEHFARDIIFSLFCSQNTLKEVSITFSLLCLQNILQEVLHSPYFAAKTLQEILHSTYCFPRTLRRRCHTYSPYFAKCKQYYIL